MKKKEKRDQGRPTGQHGRCRKKRTKKKKTNTNQPKMQNHKPPAKKKLRQNKPYPPTPPSRCGSVSLCCLGVGLVGVVCGGWGGGGGAGGGGGGGEGEGGGG